ncbi:HNH endonuclease signature motif containing protein [Streptomyces lanatus]|uniref:HNH endonuclease signature motif containing protein n=1 Tax=Streptomyces lanatus TaxID=66900 RepID=A0ABV1XID7_9ACTN
MTSPTPVGSRSTTRTSRRTTGSSRVTTVVARWSGALRVTPTVPPIKGQPDDAQIDHEIPKAQGGCGSPHNGCVACRRCNRDKSAKRVEQWDDELREFLPEE